MRTRDTALMTSGSPGEAAPLPLIEPIEGVLAVLDRGNATGTNKLGLLLALLDLAPCAPERRISTRLIAEKLLEIHWDHVRPFPAGEGRQAVPLTQVTSGNRETQVITQVKRLRSQLSGPRADWPYSRVRRDLEQLPAWADAIRAIERDAYRNPIDKLQTIDRQRHTFLYTIEADGIMLTERAAQELTRFGPVLKELVQARFVRQVMKANRALSQSVLEVPLAEHLFGAERDMPGHRVRSELARLQGGRCLYSGEALARHANALDHVIPWSRVRMTTLGNFAVTTRQVNSAKSGLLLAYAPLAAWVEHVTAHKEPLTQLAADTGWPAGVDDTLSVALAVYRSAAQGRVLWAPGGVGTAADTELARITDLLEQALN